MKLKLRVSVPVSLSRDTLNALLQQRFGSINQDLAIRAARRVLTQTVLQEYRKVLLRSLPELLSPELSNYALEKLRLPAKQRDDYLKLVAQRDAALLAGRGTKGIERQLRRQQASIALKLERRNSTFQGNGQYRTKLFQVFDLLTNPNNLQVWFVGNTLHFGIGPLGQLNAIRTPTAAKNRLYPKALLWKQVEYGAGVYSTDPRGRRKPKGWKFGALRLKGIKGVGVATRLQAEARNPQTPWMQQLRAAVLEAVITG